MADFGNVALSTRQVLSIFLLLACGGLLIGGFVTIHPGPNQLPGDALPFWIGAGVCGVLSAVFMLWHIQNVRQPDLHPDILAQLFGPERVFEMDTLHFNAAARQLDNSARLIVMLQNVYDAAVTGRIDFPPMGATVEVPHVVQHLEFQLEPGEVVACWRDIALPAQPPRDLTFGIQGFIPKVKGKRIRFKRRAAVRAEMPAALTVAAVLTTHLHYQPSGTRITLRLTPAMSDPAPTATALPWQTLSLWSLQDPRDIDAVKQLLSHLST